MSADDMVEEKSRRRRRRSRDEDADAESDESQQNITQSKGRATRSRRHSDDVETGNFVTRAFGGIRAYFQGVNDELDKVVWPTREEAVRLSGIVIAVTVASALVLGTISFFFTELFIQGIREDQPIVFVFFGLAIVGAIVAFTVYNRGRDDINSPY